MVRNEFRKTYIFIARTILRWVSIVWHIYYPKQGKLRANNLSIPINEKEYKRSFICYEIRSSLDLVSFIVLFVLFYNMNLLAKH